MMQNISNISDAKTQTNGSKIDANAFHVEAENLLNGNGANGARLEHKDVLNEILEMFAGMENLDFRVLAELKEGDNLTQKDCRIICVDELLKTVREKHLGLARKHDFIFAFNGEFWREIPRDALENFLCQLAQKQGVKWLEARDYEFRRKIFLQFLADAFFEPIEPPDKTVLINLRNGTFEINEKTQTLRKFRAADFLTYQLPFDFDENAVCPMFQRFLDRVLPEPELQAVLAEFFGYVFIKHLKLETALILYGDGENGKSVVFDVMNKLLGEENISRFSLSNLMEEHNRALIANKLLNYGSEMNAKNLNVDIVKTLISTEPVQARLKYGQSFELEALKYAKLCFNSNSLPKDIEHTHAYFRRLKIIPFRVKITPQEKDVQLAEKIITGELSGVFNWILDGLRRLLKNKNFTQSEIIDGQLADYKKESDSVALFIDESAEIAFVGLSVKNAYSDYRTFCIDCGYKPLGKNNFSKRMELHGFLIEKKEVGQVITMKRG